MEYNEDGDPVMPDYTVCPKGSIARIESKEENDFIKTFLSKSEGKHIVRVLVNLVNKDGWSSWFNKFFILSLQCSNLDVSLKIEV